MKCFVIGDGTKDVLSSFMSPKLPLYLAYSDIRQRYRRSTLGPFWITLSTAIMITCVGLIFSRIYASSANVFLPYLACGIISWNFISSTLNDATRVFSSAEAIIKQLPLPLFVHVERMVARNFYIFLHNLIILPVLYLLINKSIEPAVILLVPGVVLLIGNLLWMSLSIGIICSRYRDLQQIVSSILQIFFYITPILWMPNLVSGRVNTYLLNFNPLHHFIELIRAPLVGQYPSLLSWGVALSIFVFGSVFTNLIFNKFKRRIAYWL